jgi:hypothetical protein
LLLLLLRGNEGDPRALQRRTMHSKRHTRTQQIRSQHTDRECRRGETGRESEEQHGEPAIHERGGNQPTEGEQQTPALRR